MSKQDPIHDLEKIPDSEFIKFLQIELGKKESYIQELEHRLSEYSLGKEVYVKKLENDNRSLRYTINTLNFETRNLEYQRVIANNRKTITSLRKTISDLICRLNASNIESKAKMTINY